MHNKHLSFTGTRNEPTDEQLIRLEATLDILRQQKQVFHHGDCKGADAAAAYLAYRVGYYVVAHPPDVKTYRAFAKFHEETPAYDYLTRDRHIVEASNILISVPRKTVTLQEILNCENGTRRGGTYYTTRYALQHKKEVMMILPSGAMEHGKVVNGKVELMWYG